MDKPSKLLAKLLEQTKLDTATITKLRAELATADDRCKKAIDNALSVTAAEFKAKLDSVRQIGVDYVNEINTKHAALWSEAEEQRDKLVTQLKLAKQAGSEILERLTASEDEVKNLMVIKAELEDKLGRLRSVEARAALIDAQQADLQKLVSRIEERGRKREAEEANAIANRKAATFKPF